MNRLAHSVALIFVTLALNTSAQYSPITAGDWDAFLTWLSTPPGAGNNVNLLIWDVTVAGTNEACNNLTVNSAIIVNGGGSLDVNGALDLNSGGIVDINNGTINVDGNLDYDGTLDITNNVNNYLDVTGNIRNGGNLRWQTVNGSIRIYSELGF